MKLHPLNVADYGVLKQFFQTQPYRLSVYSLASIIAWSGQGFRSLYAIENGSVIIANESTDDPEDRHLMLPVSPGGTYDPEQLQGIARQFGFVNYWYVPEDYLQAYGRKRIERHFNVMEQGEYEDYVYHRDDLVQLRGNRFVRKRNLIHQFTKMYQDKGRVSVERMNFASAAESIDFLQKWCDIRNCDQIANLACEKRAIIKTINNIEALEVMGLIVRVDGFVSAFGIGSYLNQDTAVLNFEKAFSQIRGLYQFLDREWARQLFAQYQYVNKESDLNIPNLAKSKKSYHPVIRVKSYRLELCERGETTA